MASDVEGSIRLRRTINQEGAAQWAQVEAILVQTEISQGADVVKWPLEASGVYLVSSMYAKLSQGATVAHFTEIWAAKLPLKNQNRFLAAGPYRSINLLEFSFLSEQKIRRI